MAEQELKKISQEELDEILEQHKVWIESSYTKGAKANLSKLDLDDLVFSNRNLSYIDCTSSSLKSSNFQNSILKYARFIHSDLTNADLEGSDLQSANFANAILYKANLYKTKNQPDKIKNYLSKKLTLDEEILIKQREIADLSQESKENKQKIAALEQAILDLKTKNNIETAIKALETSLKNTDTQITNNQKFSRSLVWLVVILICLDIAFVLVIPFLIMAGNLNELLDKTGIWAILFFTFPALLILLIALSLLRHQKQLIAEIRHYSMLKHKIELYGGILKAAQYTASSVMQYQNSEAAKYIQETFNEIKTELLKSPNFDLNAQPHIFPEEGGNLVEMLKSITELLKISTEANKVIAESAKKATTSEK